MKLQKYKERNNKQKSIVIFTIACILLITGVFLYKTFASFQVVENEDLINGSIEDPGDIYFVFYKDGKISKTMPLKNEGYAYDYEKSHCEVPGKEETKNKAIPYFDSIDWSVTVRGMSERPTKCTLYFYKGYQDENLHGTDPVLERPLIPVHIDETGKVTKVDPSQKWYDYAQKQWANAVILVDETKQYEVDQEIEEKDIESYFVWIPRYKYKLKDNEETFNTYTSVTSIGNVGNVSEFYNQHANQATNNAFEIEFENNTIEPSVTTTKDQWLTHPAFISFNSNGFWVGKFETGYNQNKDIGSQIINTSSWTRSNAEKNTEEPNKVIIKPNVYSWRDIQVANAFYTSYNYQRELESHMMKNSEWGAVAYLTNSKYGRCASDKGPCEEVRINNSSNYVTGASNKNVPTCGSTGTNEVCNHYEDAKLTEDSENINNYLNQESGKSSTTGNHTGIYDMSGGAWEYVMGVMQGGEQDKTPASGKNLQENSGFNGPLMTDGSLTTGKDFPVAKYYDLYEYNSFNTGFQKGHLGDGTKEMGPFYSVTYNSVLRHIGSYNADDAFFVCFDGPWFVRGENLADGSDAGVFAFSSKSGYAFNWSSFRIILTP